MRALAVWLLSAGLCVNAQAAPGKWVRMADWVNQYINQVIPYDPHSGPLKQDLRSAMQGGQCRDYVRHKAGTLLMSGVPRESLHVMIGLYQGRPHSVLAFKPEGADEPLILDSYVRNVLPLSEREDLADFETIDLPGDWT